MNRFTTYVHSTPRRMALVVFLAVVTCFGTSATASPQLAIQRASTGTNSPTHADSGVCSISEDGRFAAYASDAADLVANDTNGVTDVFRFDHTTGRITLVSVPAPGQAANQASGGSVLGGKTVAISSTGQFVTFISNSKLTAQDFNGTGDVYLRDMVNNTTTLISLTPFQPFAIGGCSEVAISGDGLTIAFTCSVDVLPLDANGQKDVYVATYNPLVWPLALAALDPGNNPFINGSSGPTLSKSGRYASFVAVANPPVNGNLRAWSRQIVGPPVTTATSYPQYQAHYPDFSNTGRFLCYFDGLALNVHYYDRDVSNSGVYDTPGNTADTVIDPGSTAWGAGFYASISPDGRYVVFNSNDPALINPDANGNVPDTFVWDSLTGVSFTVHVSDYGVQGSASCLSQPDISMDGKVVAFASQSPSLVPQDTDSWMDTFVNLGPSSVKPFCFADGSPGSVACPCGNIGTAGRGCQNSGGTGGGRLDAASGVAQLSNDTLVLAATHLDGTTARLYVGLPSPTPYFAQDGTLCMLNNGAIYGLGVVAVSGGTAVFPGPGQPSISQQQPPLHPILPGQAFAYQVIYTGGPGFICIQGASVPTNVTSGVIVRWAP